MYDRSFAQHIGSFRVAALISRITCSATTKSRRPEVLIAYRGAKGASTWLAQSEPGDGGSCGAVEKESLKRLSLDFEQRVSDACQHPTG